MSLLDVGGGSSILSLINAGWRSSGRILINRRSGGNQWRLSDH